MSFEAVIGGKSIFATYRGKGLVHENEFKNKSKSINHQMDYSQLRHECKASVVTVH